jgi:hypothetical protein
MEILYINIVRKFLGKGLHPLEGVRAAEEIEILVKIIKCTSDNFQDNYG